MKALEFEAQINPDHTLSVPPIMADQLPPGRPVRVLLLVAESAQEQEEAEERAWKHMAAEQFLKGYDESDAIYDQLPGG